MSTIAKYSFVVCFMGEWKIRISPWEPHAISIAEALDSIMLRLRDRCVMAVDFVPLTYTRVLSRDFCLGGKLM